MRKVFLFMMISLDGYFEGKNHDITWHQVDGDFNEFAIRQIGEVGTMLFGRRTYQLMEEYWPTEQALKNDGVIAKIMNETPKVVFSKSLREVNETNHWKNVTLMHDNFEAEVKKLKDASGGDIAIFGSNNLIVQLAEAGLVDEFRVITNPIVLGAGTPLFYGIKKKLVLKLLSSHIFKNGNVSLNFAAK